MHPAKAGSIGARTAAAMLASAADKRNEATRMAPIPVSTLPAAQWAANHGIGLFNLVTLPWWLAAIATLAVRSFADYGTHVAMHKMSVLWRLHRIHHLDTHLDVSTSLRAHPLDFV